MKGAILKLLIILSPVMTTIAVSSIWTAIKGTSGQEAFGVIIFVTLLMGVPSIALTGLFVSYLSRNSVQAIKWSYIGYLVPAALINIFILVPFIF